MHTPLLRRLFAQALKTSLVSPLLLVGCNSADTEGFSSPLCDDSSISVAQLTPAVIPDVLELRVGSAFGEDPEPHVLSRTGEACATATDRPTCESAFSALRSKDGFRRQCGPSCSVHYFAYSRGDEVGLITSRDALRGFLGPVDVPQEAVLLTYLADYDVSCQDLERGGVKQVSDGFEVIATRGHASGEGSELRRYLLHVSAEGNLRELENEVLEKGEGNYVIGRRPAGLVPQKPARGAVGGLGHHFAVAAQLEAASVAAFLQLRDELRIHGAERSLQRRALRSAREEVRHARVTARLAHRFGGKPERAVVQRQCPRSLFEVALENATEGCVRETYGALVGHHQATHAKDPSIRRVMQDIAEDETRHAGLSWDVDAWARRKLGRKEASLVRAAQLAAVRKLREEAAAPVERELMEAAGWPSPEAAVAMVESLDASLWRQA